VTEPVNATATAGPAGTAPQMPELVIITGMSGA
jgi:hypothetical protein